MVFLLTISNVCFQSSFYNKLHDWVGSVEQIELLRQITTKNWSDSKFLKPLPAGMPDHLGLRDNEMLFSYL